MLTKPPFRRMIASANYLIAQRFLFKEVEMAVRKMLDGKEKSKGSNSEWLNRNVIGMALASFFSDAGHEFMIAGFPVSRIRESF